MAKTASINIEGDLEQAFESVRQYMIERVPGIKPNNAEVIRAAVLMAAKQVPVGIVNNVSDLQEAQQHG